MLNLRHHASLVDRVLAAYGLPSATALVVDDVREWCVSQGFEEHHSNRLARCFPLMNPFTIVLRAEQTEDMIASAKSRMCWDGLDDQVARLDTDEKYIVHLLLHEIAALVLMTGEQRPRDEWAFTELQRHFSEAAQ